MRCGFISRTSMRSGHRSGKSSSAIKETDSAIWARMALSLVLERTIIVGTSWGLRTSLSATEMGCSSFGCQVRPRESMNKRTHIFQPSKLHHVFEVHAGGEAYGAILGGIQDESQEVDNKGGLSAVALE